jgi:hypothetical protein
MFAPSQSRRDYKYVGDMAVDLAGDIGEMALDLAQFRAIQGAARDETKEIRFNNMANPGTQM